MEKKLAWYRESYTHNEEKFVDGPYSEATATRRSEMYGGVAVGTDGEQAFIRGEDGALLGVDMPGALNWRGGREEIAVFLSGLA